MRKSVILLLLILLSADSGICAHGPKEKPRNVILIGWDGVGRKNVKEELARGALPHLKELSSKGALVAIDITRNTDTKAGWAQILTGYEPETTKVFSNEEYGPIPKGYTIFERLKKFFRQSGLVIIALIGKKEHIESRTLFQPYYYAKDSCDLFLTGLGRAVRVGNQAVGLIEEYKDRSFFFFVHFGGSDKAGHTSGEGSGEYNRAIEDQDHWLGMIMKKLKALGIDDKTLIYVVSDHGFDVGKRRHSDAPYSFLATNDPLVVRDGERADIAPTILERFGMDLSAIKPPLDGHPLTRPYKKPMW